MPRRRTVIASAPVAPKEHVLNRIEPYSAAKVLAVAGIIVGLATWLLALLFMPFYAAPFHTYGWWMMAGMMAMMGTYAYNTSWYLSTLVLLPVTYAIWGFVCGALGAYIYNAVASWVGGIKVELK